MRAEITAQMRAEIGQQQVAHAEEMSELRKHEVNMKVERDTMAAQARSSTDEGRLVAERVKALQKQIDEQRSQHRLAEQGMIAAVNRERSGFREAENAADHRHESVAQ